MSRRGEERPEPVVHSAYPGITTRVAPGPNGGFLPGPLTGPGWHLTWHHHPTVPRLLQLVPRAQHTRAITFPAIVAACGFGASDHGTRARPSHDPRSTASGHRRPKVAVGPALHRRPTVDMGSPDTLCRGGGRPVRGRTANLHCGGRPAQLGTRRLRRRRCLSQPPCSVAVRRTIRRGSNTSMSSIATSRTGRVTPDQASGRSSRVLVPAPLASLRWPAQPRPQIRGIQLPHKRLPVRTLRCVMLRRGGSRRTRVGWPRRRRAVCMGTRCVDAAEDAVPADRRGDGCASQVGHHVGSEPDGSVPSAELQGRILNRSRSDRARTWRRSSAGWSSVLPGR